MKPGIVPGFGGDGYGGGYFSLPIPSIFRMYFS